MEKTTVFRKFEVIGTTKDEAIKESGLNLRGDATQAYKKWAENNPTNEDNVKEFCKEYPNVQIKLQKTCDKFHDRFIILDYGTDDEKIYHCGGSSKDGGRRTTVLSRLEDVEIYDDMIKELLSNPVLKLK